MLNGAFFFKWLLQVLSGRAKRFRTIRKRKLILVGLEARNTTLPNFKDWLPSSTSRLN